MWTPQNQKTLEVLAAEGFSARDIAGVLGITRNAVIGRAHRTGVTLDFKSPPGKPRTPKFTLPEERRKHMSEWAKARHASDPSWRALISATQKARQAKLREERA